jgi:sulfite dehydrogenase (cytochrome) subunit B
MLRMIMTCVLIGTAMASKIAMAAPVSYELPAETTTLRPGPGVEAAQGNCLACHSSDYIAMQPPKLGKPFWDAEVAKMIKVYKAPISNDDAKAIADYLSATY